MGDTIFELLILVGIIALIVLAGVWVCVGLKKGVQVLKDKD